MAAKLEELAQRIRDLREERGYSQQEFAKLAKATQAQVSSWERGLTFPGVESLLNIATAFGTTIQDILDEKHPNCAPPRPPTRREMVIWILELMQFSQPQIERIRHALAD